MITSDKHRTAMAFSKKAQLLVGKFSWCLNPFLPARESLRMLHTLEVS